MQWAMLYRDFHMTSMTGIADISTKHPNGPGCKRKTRLETACKYYSLISKLQVSEAIHNIEGTRTHESWVNMSCKCMYCGEPVSETKYWKRLSQAAAPPRRQQQPNYVSCARRTTKAIETT